MVSITQLEYLVAVDEERHFGRAAEKCHVSQPSLSTQIQKMEDDLGLVIFDRSKKPILPTEEGVKVIDQAKVTLKEHRKLAIIAQMSSGEVEGFFHLGVIPTLSPYIVPLFLKSFTEKYPRVSLKISELQTHEILKKLNDDELDGGLLVTPLGEDLIERHLFYEPFYAFVSNNHPISKLEHVKSNELSQHEIWLLEEGHCFRDQMINICSSRRNQKVMDTVEFSCGSFETLVNLVKTNCGYTLLPELAAKNLSREDFKKHIKKFAEPIPTREVSIVHSRHFLKERIIQAIEDSILINLPPEIKSLKKEKLEVVSIS